MAILTFEARDSSGKAVRGVETVTGLRELDQLLESRGLVLIRAREGGRKQRGTRMKRNRILIDFCYHLATAIEAGVPLTTALRDLQDAGRSPIAEVLDDVTRKVEAGSPLSESIADYPQLFPPLVSALVSAGEQTGKLPEILRDLVEYLEWTDELRRKLSSALTYPCIVLVGLVGLCVLLTTVVLPNFMSIFTELNVDLPLVTRVLLRLQAFLSKFWLPLVIGLATASVSFVLFVRSESGRVSFHRWLLRTPILGSVISMIEMSRFSHNLGLLHASGIPIVRALEMVTEIVQNRVVRSAVAESAEGVRRGESLTNAFGHRDFMPPMVMRMIALGETSGRLDESLDHIAGYYDREVPGIIDRALAFFNTGVVATLGFVLGAVALGLFVPLYEMMGNLNAP